MRILLQVIAFTTTLAITMVLQTAMSVTALAQAPYRPLPRPYATNMQAVQPAAAYCYAVQRSTVPVYAPPPYSVPQYGMPVQHLNQSAMGYAPPSDPRLTLNTCFSGGLGPVSSTTCKGTGGTSTDVTVLDYFTFGGATNLQGQKQYYGCMGPNGSVGSGLVATGSAQLCMNQHGSTYLATSAGVGVGASIPGVAQSSLTARVSYQVPLNPGMVSRNLTTGPPPWLMGR